jgi:phosphocarrier protein HPr
MLEQHVKIINKLGLHVRAATKLVQTASEFDADISISCNDQTADAKSIMDVLMLAAIIGTEINIAVSGDTVEDEKEALNSIISLIENRFDEGE